MKNLSENLAKGVTGPAEFRENGILSTPKSIVVEMVNRIPEEYFTSSTTTFFDPACGYGTFLRYVYLKLREKGHSHENSLSRIYGIDKFSPANETKRMFPNIIKKDFLKEMPKQWPDKFNIVVSNPPYSKKLDLKFLEKSIDLATDEILFVHPSSFLVDGKGLCKEYHRLREKSRNILESITFFNGNPIFEIDQYVPCTITHLSKKSEKDRFNFEYSIYGQKLEIKKSDLDKISNFGYSDALNTLKEKISNSIDRFGNLHSAGNFIGGGGKDHLKVLKNPNSFFVEFTHIRGHAESNRMDRMIKEDFFTLVKRDVSVSSGRNPSYNIWFEFETEEEANNFISYIKSDFVRACLATVKMNQHLARGEMKFIPLVDFRSNWSEENIYKHFGITEEEKKFIREIIPPYYQ